MSWKTTRATTVSINQGIGEVLKEGSLTIPSPEVPTKYTLTASNDAALLKADVPTPPSASFYFSPNSVELGKSTTLYWNSQCSTSRSIDHDIGPVPVSGSQLITPEQSSGYHYYYLDAENGGGNRRYSAYVYVQYPPVSPEYFNISPRCNMTPGAPLTLSWNINNATNVSISPEVGPVNAAGSTVVNPAAAGTYTLTATVAGRLITRSVSFPDYPSVNISPYYSAGIDLGQSMNISYWSQCADTVTFNQEIVANPNNGTISVTPESLPKTYTVTATNERGSRSSSVQLYQVLPQLSVTPYKKYMDLGEYLTISWSSRYADKVSIDQGIGEVPLSNSITIAPRSLPMTYTVRATNSAGTTVRSVYLYPTAPTGSLTAYPSEMKVGDSTTLTWTSSHAASCSITPDIGPVPYRGFDFRNRCQEHHPYGSNRRRWYLYDDRSSSRQLQRLYH